VSWSVVATLVPIHIYQCTGFQLPSSINFSDMEGSKNQKVEAADTAHASVG